MSEEEEDKAPQENPQPTLKHRVEFALFRALEGVLGLMSLPTVAKIGGALGLAAHALSAKRRRLVRRNLRIATAASPPADMDGLVRETFRRSGANMLASQRAATMPPGKLREYLSLEGFEHLLDPLRGGRGVVMVWAHMGNWEVLAQLIREVGGDIQGGPIYRPLENPLLDALTLKRRTQEGAVVFSKHDGFNGPAGLLRRGGVVPVMADQRAGGHGELCQFFGRLSSCTPLPTLLARRTGTAIVSLSIASQPGGRWLLTIRPVPDNAKTPEVMSHLETAMRDSLADIFWFHDRWRTDKMMPLGFYTKDSPAAAAAKATQPTRMAATLRPGSPDSIATITTLLELRPDLRIDIIGDASGLPDDPRIVRFPGAITADLLERCDASHPVPLDFVLLLDGNAELAGQAKELGLRAIIGVGTSGKPWTRHFPVPGDAADWRELAIKLVLTAKARKKEQEKQKAG
ncbi:lysophospholipid acyltransferase family protein [Haloferula sp. BvORR071]|uniref:lysophospholipid acyltransferase family protein n=1 Tax=Haloferula sp. BvORR071 TaxID=1396141 RepID=UPI000696760D|nr:lysophospholipid acyltransferase family protein [Haloferula sp. BvORR071]